MSELARKFANEILLLPREDRAELIHTLLESLNVPFQKDIYDALAEEAERRVKEYENGKIKALDGEQVIKEIRNRISR